MRKKTGHAAWKEMKERKPEKYHGYKTKLGFFKMHLFPSQLERSTLIILKLSVKLSGKVSQR